MDVQTNLLNAVMWNYGEKGAAFSGVLATAGVLFNGLVGGYDVMIKALLFFMVFDFITGFACSLKKCGTSSQKMFWGGVNKLFVFIMVGAAVILDTLLGNTTPLLRTAIIWFYIGREGLSMVENLGNLGVDIFEPLQKALIQIEKKGE